MSITLRSSILLLVSGLCVVGCSTMTATQTGVKSNPSTTPLAAQDPADLYHELFERVQMEAVYPDSKTFVDMLPRFSPTEILKSYRSQTPKTPEELKKFVEAHFFPPGADSHALASTSDAVGKLPIDEHIAKLWKELSRKPDVGVEDVSSLIPLPFAYVVPGGRFREIYYWDSYFTQLGLLADGEDEIFKGMVQNFSHLLQATGRIPNGNRDYYRGRSQPPFFSLMISLWQERYGQQSALAFLPVLKTEHTFWMTGSRAVKVGETEVLNRYWDDRAAPRPEAYKEDVKLAKHAEAKLKRSPSDVFRDLRAGAESGWDFGTRWFRDSNEFATISTTEFLPVDLNCLIYQLETKIAELSALNGDEAEASRFRDLAAQRKALIQTYFWNSKSGTFRDYDLKNRAVSGEDTLAMLMPLFVGVATEVQAKSVEKVLTAKFLKAGGLVTTLKMSGHQWDSPNGWAPLQWLGYAGLQRYGLTKTASLVQKRWLALNEKVYQATGKMMEKYDVIDLKKMSGGGEYPNQDGFGWTNGVYKALKNSKTSLRHLGFQTEADKP